MAKQKAKSKSKKATNYDNSGRLEKSQQTQQLIIKTMVQILVERRGGDVQFFEIAKKSGVSERSIFRFFKDKEALLRATDTYIMSYLQAGITKIEDKGIVNFAKDIFALFDENEDLTMAYLYSPFGREARVRLRQKLNEVLVARIMKENKKPMTAEKKAKIALIISMISAKLWDDMRTDFGLTGAQMGEVVGWAVKNLLAKLD